MALTVNTNVSAMATRHQLKGVMSDASTSLERLSSGSRINTAKDDAAGLQIANRLHVQTRGIDVAIRNANDGMSIVETAESSLDETTNIMLRMRDLSIQSANGNNSDADRQALQHEVSSLNDELNRIAETTSFGGEKLINGTYGTKSFHIGPNTDAIMVSLTDMRTDSERMGGDSYLAQNGKDSNWTVTDATNQLNIQFQDVANQTVNVQIEAKSGDNIEELATYINGQTDEISASVNENGQLQLFAPNHDVKSDLTFSGSLASELALSKQGQLTVDSLNISTVGGAQQAIAVLDASLTYVDSQRGQLGAIHNRFESGISNLGNMSINVNDSKGQLRDADFAKEATSLTKSKILQQASNAIIAQANQLPSAATNLLH
ncbi:Flagellin D [Vibrio nigripulchritudo MADA3029]|uniref:Flagellin n=1 Tax=Vibrio nigripulchritudo TaxID=28173 RepID=U4KDI7_9VIBR|nr:flagellin [Vibrio nigripulchritudo]KJY80211.1 flagellin [Vibrio nigripulchritudo]CCN33017.1 Flagellin D [Vibrio nigripulchritudo AM115]CCN41348.1 Flagellin D [Vibrio nigripulchritudo FTn2]CCN48769.1 Flagellin D [Vibrio nigripulchritudo MADA3020]CCN52832.1 Flagellin D [Vibrio nigripulchritudo MADA3021]